jgi:hypothetical protein
VKRCSANLRGCYNGLCETNISPPVFGGYLSIQAKSILDIPVPKILAYCATADNPVGSEYIIMEEAQGIQLSKVWDTMDLKDQLGIVTELVAIDEKLLFASLNRYVAALTHKLYIVTFVMTIDMAHSIIRTTAFLGVRPQNSPATLWIA